jgi:hypothetical protein
MPPSSPTARFFGFGTFRHHAVRHANLGTPMAITGQPR